MKHPIDETYQTVVDKASAEFKSRRDQILALRNLSGFQYIIDYFDAIQRAGLKELQTATLETETDKKNIYQVRGEYKIASDFLQFIQNLEKSKERW